MLFIAMLCFAVVHARSVCDQQETQVEQCAYDLQNVVLQMSSYDDLTPMCSSAQSFLTCVEEANSACPSLPLLQDENFQSATEALRQQISPACPTSSALPESKCDDVAERLTECNTNVNSVFNACDYIREVLGCITPIVDECKESKEVKALERETDFGELREFVRDQCPQQENDSNENTGNEVQGNRGTTSPPQVRGRCQKSKVEWYVSRCTRHISDQGHPKACKRTRRFIRCMERVMEKCPESRPEYQDFINHYIEVKNFECENGGRGRQQNGACDPNPETEVLKCLPRNVDQLAIVDMHQMCELVSQFKRCSDMRMIRCNYVHRTGMKSVEEIFGMPDEYLSSLCQGVVKRNSNVEEDEIDVINDAIDVFARSAETN